MPRLVKLPAVLTGAAVPQMLWLIDPDRSQSPPPSRYALTPLTSKGITACPAACRHAGRLGLIGGKADPPLPPRAGPGALPPAQGGCRLAAKVSGRGRGGHARPTPRRRPCRVGKALVGLRGGDRMTRQARGGRGPRAARDVPEPTPSAPPDRPGSPRARHRPGAAGLPAGGPGFDRRPGGPRAARTGLYCVQTTGTSGQSGPAVRFAPAGRAMTARARGPADEGA